MKNRILITGGAGFIGHQVIYRFLRDTDFDVVTLDRLDTSGNLNRIREVLDLDPEWEKRFSFIWHDLKSPLNATVANQIGKITHIVHLAAGSHVDRSIEDPMSFVMDNVVGTTNLLLYAKQLPKEDLKLMINFSTDEVFGPAPEGIFYKEWDRYNSGNPYSASKASAEEMCLAFQNTYQMPIINTHTMNVFGVRQHSEKFVPLLIKRIRDNETVTIHSNSQKTKAGSRFYINTDDVADAILFLLENSTIGDKYNIVGKEEIDNLQLAKMVSEIMGKELNYEMVDFHSSRPGHDLRYSLCGEKMKALGWEPKVEIYQRLEEVVKWTLENDRWLK